jgi:hypothetical protein
MSFSPTRQMSDDKTHGSHKFYNLVQLVAKKKGNEHFTNTINCLLDNTYQSIIF